MPPKVDTGIFVDSEVPQAAVDAIKTATFTLKLLQRVGIIGALPSSPINIRPSGQNSVEVKLTLAKGTIEEIQKGIAAATRTVVIIGAGLLAAGGLIGYSCSQAMHAENTSLASPQTK
ncbi:hypothetical protein HYW83_01790 [Candidatus Peregrinibacteria bacterium]|nr:hypothetical protein [Candidatus Peregrinibacteria bacterium]